MHSSRCRSRSVGGAQGGGRPARGWQPASRRRSARDRSRSPRSWGACPVLVWAVWACSMGTVARLAPLTTCLYEPPGGERLSSECTTAVYGVVGIRAEAGSLHPSEGVAARSSVIACRLYQSTYITARIS